MLNVNNKSLFQYHSLLNNHKSHSGLGLGKTYLNSINLTVAIADTAATSE
jgi:hypothetical protein